MKHSIRSLHGTVILFFFENFALVVVDSLLLFLWTAFVVAIQTIDADHDAVAAVVVARVDDATKTQMDFFGVQKRRSTSQLLLSKCMSIIESKKKEKKMMLANPF